MKRVALFSILLVPALMLSACSAHLGLSKILGGGSSSAASAKTAKATRTPSAGADAISISSGHFRPKNLTVKVGSTLTWTNNDKSPESVTSDAPGVFDSGALNSGATFAFTFSQAGTFPYHSTTSPIYGSITVAP
jgi:plastocyanin